MSQKKADISAEGFIGSIFKYSISTFANLGIYGISMLLTGLFIPENMLSPVAAFNSWTATIMNVAILGLDQSLIRFYHEPPASLSKNGLFRLCFSFSGLILLVGGCIGSVFFAGPIYSGVGFGDVSGMLGTWVVPLLFLNAFFYMVARYFNVLYRMEGNIGVYTAESILMQFFYRLFFVLGAFLGFENPVPAMIICAVGGLGAFALVFSFLRRDALSFRKNDFRKEGYKAVVPYGVAVAPTAIMLTLNYSITQSYLIHSLGSSGMYAYAYQLSNIVTMVQGGFASFWGPFMFANYKTQQPRIKRVHNYLNLIIIAFFSVLVGFEDIIFFILREYKGAQPIFPLMMLSAVFTILCETTVYGNAIARRPIFDTLGHALSFVVNVSGLLILVPMFGLNGAAVALVCANASMFFLRTATAQKLYSSIENFKKTLVAIAIAVLIAIGGTIFAHMFMLKLMVSIAGVVCICLLYRKEFIYLLKTALNIAKKIIVKK